MDFQVDATIAFPRDVVFRAYRDELERLATHIPDVRAFEQQERSEFGARTSIVNVWHGGGDIPSFARVFLTLLSKTFASREALEAPAGRVRLVAERTTRQPPRDHAGHGEAKGSEGIAKVSFRPRVRADAFYGRILPRGEKRGLVPR